MIKGLLGGFSAEIDTDRSKIHDILNRGVEEVFIRESLEKKLKSGRQLKIKLGFDPTGDQIHIGRAITLWKLRAFQDLGHQIIFIVGDFTARIGDPSDKLEKRPMLSVDLIKKNLRNYKKQIGKIIDVNRAKFLFNSTWLSKLNLEEISELAESFSVQQMSNRRNFKDRMDNGMEVSLREFLYPLMQGYDSVVVKADVEIGGFDQLFNLKAGRIIQKHYKMSEQDVLTTKMLLGTDGRKMSTSWGNVINISDEPDQMFGKIMSVRDDLIENYFSLCTKVSETELKRVVERLSGGENPRDIKIDLAKTIVSLYYGESSAKKSAENFVATFSEKKAPENILVINVKNRSLLVDALLSNQLVSSKTEFRRLIQGGAVTNMDEGKTITDQNLTIKENMTLKIGKHRFAKIIVS